MLRYGAAAVAAFVFLIGIFYTFQVLFEQKRLVEKESRINVWFLAQVEKEYLRTMESLAQFGLSPSAATKEAFVERIDIFWSRLPVLLKGPQAAGLREIEGLVGTVNAITRQLEAVEPDIQRLKADDRNGLWEVHAKLERIRKPIGELMRRGLLYESEEVNNERAKHETYYYNLLAFFAATLLAGIIIFISLIAQVARTRRAVEQALAAEDAAKAARTQLEVAIGSISEGFILYDRESRVVLFNERYRELHPAQADFLAVGITFEQLLRISVERGGISIPPERLESWIAECFQQHRNPGAAFESRLRDGRWLKISERRTVDGRIVGIHTDISELKQREEQLQQKSNLLQATLDNMSNGIAVFDRERRLLLCNDLFLEMHGLTREFAGVGRPYADIVRENSIHGEYGPGSVDEHIENQSRLVTAVVKGDGAIRRAERRRPSGEVIEIAYAKLPDGGFVKTCSDVTDRVQAERERAQLQEQFHAAERMHAIGTLAGGIAHDFNNILGIMMGNCELLLGDLDADGKGREELNTVLSAGERARSLVRQILTYSRQTEVERRPVDAGHVVAECLTNVRAMLPKNVAIEKGSWASPTIAADSAQLHQVVLNLCINAAHAIGGNQGRVVVSIDEIAVSDPRVEIDRKQMAEGADRWSRYSQGALRSVRYCRISVRDTGSGIDPSILPRIFDPFFTTKEVGKGTGLGLAAVHGIVRNHGGAVVVESATGEGTCFFVYLPTYEHKLAPLPSEPEVKSLRGRERVLLVDDDRNLLTVTARALTREGYAVDAFSAPEEALVAFVKEPQRWDVVVSDRNMPNMSGEALIKSIVKARPDVPIVMMTGFATVDDEDRMKEIGVRSLVFKPVFGRELTVALRRLLDRPQGSVANVA
jgi:signal transduction histidine kinase/ActR/RegA family two-component response regulator